MLVYNNFSKTYVVKEVPMEEAQIAFAKHGDNGSVIPVYIDGTPLPKHMLDPKGTNYFRSDIPAEIASHLAARIRMLQGADRQAEKFQGRSSNTAFRGTPNKNIMNIHDNTALKQDFYQNVNIINGADNYGPGR